MTDIIDTVTGEVIDPTDIDGLARELSGAKADRDDAYRRIHEIEDAIVARATAGEGRTRRVSGETTRIKLEFPGPSWEQATLRRAWVEFPDLATRYLKIATLSTIAAEVKKLRSESGPETFEAFRDVLLSAEREPTTRPKITIESGVEA